MFYFRLHFRLKPLDRLLRAKLKTPSEIIPLLKHKWIYKEKKDLPPLKEIHFLGRDPIK